MKRNLGILVSGRGSNMHAILRAVRRGYIRGVRVALVVSNREGVRALKIARSFGVEAAVIPSTGFRGDRWHYDRLLVDALEAHDVTPRNGLVILAGFDRILSDEFVAHYAGRLINIHPSLLPAFPGLHAQRQALQYGAKVSGCTVHFVVPEVDAGPIILQKAVSVLDGETEESLSNRILEEEHLLYPRAVKLVVEGRLRITGRRVVSTR